MADIDSLSIRISASTKKATDNINKLADALSNLNTQLNAINPTNLMGAANAFSQMSNAAGTMRGVGRTMQSIARQTSNMAQQSGGLRQAADASQNLAGATQQAAQSTAGAARAMQNLGGASRSGAGGVEQVANAARNVSRNAASSASNVRRLGSATKDASKHAKVFGKELTRITKMLKLMITRMILRKIIQGVLDGFKNLAQYSSTFDATLSLLWNSFRQLGNSIAAAVSPLLNALAPALNYIIQLVIKAVNAINQLISALFGLSTWTKAKTLTDSYAKSLDGANKSAKELKKTVLGFDELNQLQDNNSGGGGGTSPKDMFEQVPIDPRILSFIDALKDKVGELAKYWDAFVNGFKRGLGDDWKQKVGLITDGIGRIQTALKDIWSDPKVSQARDRYFTSLATMLGTVAGTVVRVGLNIGANVAQGIARAIEDKSPEIKEYLVEMFDIGTDINDQISETALAIGNISDVLVGDNAISATQGFVEIYEEAFMLISENAARLGDDIVKLTTQPLIDNQEYIKQTLDDAFGILANGAFTAEKALKDLRDILKSLWEQHLHPMFESLTEGFSELSTVILNAWNYIAPVFDEATDSLRHLWQEYLKPLVDDVVSIVGIVGNLIAKLFNSVIVPAISSLVDKWMPRVKDGINIIVTFVKAVAQTIATVIQAITGTLRMFLQFFETGFTKGWGEACRELANSWAEGWESMLEKLKGIGISMVELVQDMINAIIHGLNAFGDKMAGMADITIPAWLGGGTFTFKGLAFHFDDVNLLSYFSKSGGRGFANGGFPAQGSMFLAGERGAELVGNINGRTAVANSDQITNGIAQAVFAAITSANAQSGGDVPIQTSIYIGEEQIARAVTKGQRKIDRRYSPTMA